MAQQAAPSAPAATPAATPAAPAPAAAPADSGSKAIPKIPAGKPLTNGLPPELFSDSVSAAMPLSPEQIRDLRRHTDQIKRASSTRPAGIPKPAVHSVTISLSPGTRPHVVRLAPDFVTTLVFQDSTGAPWPISSITTGNSEAFQISEIKEKKINIMTISQKEDYAMGNAAVLLEGASTPIMLTLLASQHKEMDYRVDVTVQGRGPNAAEPIVATATSEAVSRDLISVLDGIPPKGAVPLASSLEGVDAWQLGDKVMVRSAMPLLSPASLRIARSPSGMAAHEIPEASTVLVSASGRATQVSLSRKSLP